MFQHFSLSLQTPSVQHNGLFLVTVTMWFDSGKVLGSVQDQANKESCVYQKMVSSSLTSDNRLRKDLHKTRVQIMIKLDIFLLFFFFLPLS